MATTWPLPAMAPRPLRRDLAPAAGRGAEVDDAGAGFEELVLGVDLGELVGRARAEALALGGRHIRVVELALQPALRGGFVAARGLEAHVQAPIGSARARRRARLRAAFGATLAPACALWH